MVKPSKIGEDFKRKLALHYFPVGLYYSDTKPASAIGFKKTGNGCIMPLILASAKGKTVAFDEPSTGQSCSAFHLGYSDWIFPGVEYFLSHVPIMGRECERFVKTPALARAYLKSLCFQSQGAAVFKPLEQYVGSEKPEIVIFFANADQISALVFLLYFNAPFESNRVVTRFASACGSIITLPLQVARRGEKSAIWGLHDISARVRLPKELMTLTLPYFLLETIWKDMNKSFITTKRWQSLVKRIVDTSV